MKNYYSILGIDKTATDDEIKKAYRKQAMQYHPDRNAGDNKAEEKFKDISEAYAVLGDKKKKRNYDQYGSEGFHQRFSRDDIFRDFDINEMFKNFGGNPFQGQGNPFEGGNPFSQGRREPKIPILKKDLTIGFEEAALGCQRTLSISRNNIVEEIIVTVPPGVTHGKVLRLKDKGQTSITNNRRGDLHLRLDIQPHPLFRREGKNIVVDAEIKLTQALLGTIIEVETLKGIKAVKIPSGTQNNAKLKLKGMGITFPTGLKGDQLVCVKIKTPQYLTKEQIPHVQFLQDTGI